MKPSLHRICSRICATRFASSSHRGSASPPILLLHAPVIVRAELPSNLTISCVWLLGHSTKPPLPVDSTRRPLMRRFAPSRRLGPYFAAHTDTPPLTNILAAQLGQLAGAVATRMGRRRADAERQKDIQTSKKAGTRTFLPFFPSSAMRRSGAGATNSARASLIASRRLAVSPAPRR